MRREGATTKVRWRERITGDYTAKSLPCEHRSGKTRIGSLEEVVRIGTYDRTKAPGSPDEWLLRGLAGGRSVPTEGAGASLKAFADELKVRVPRFRLSANVQVGRKNAKYLCWREAGRPRH